MEESFFPQVVHVRLPVVSRISFLVWMAQANSQLFCFFGIAFILANLVKVGMLVFHGDLAVFP